MVFCSLSTRTGILRSGAGGPRGGGALPQRTAQMIIAAGPRAGSHGKGLMVKKYRMSPGVVGKVSPGLHMTTRRPRLWDFEQRARMDTAARTSRLDGPVTGK